MVSVVAKSDTGRRGERETGMSFGREIRLYFQIWRGKKAKTRRKKTEFDNVNEHGLIKTKKKEKYIRKTNNITIEGIEIFTRGGKSNS